MTVESVVVNRVGEVVSCSECSRAKASRKVIKPYITTRAVNHGGRVGDLQGRKPVQSPEVRKCKIIIKDDVSRSTNVYFLYSKYGIAKYFMKYLVDIAPRKVNMVWGDEEGGDFMASLVPNVTEKN